MKIARHPHRLILGLLSLLFLVPGSGKGLAADTRPPLVFGFDQDNPPYTFTEGGTACGYCVELLDAVLQGFPVEIRYLPLQWEEVQRQLAEGSVHLTTNMARTPERLKTFAFSEQPVSDLRVTLFTRAQTGIETLKDLPGRRVASQKGSLYADLLRAKGVAPILFDSEGEALQALERGEVDATALSLKCALYTIRKQGHQGVIPVGPPLALTSTYFAVRKDSGELLAMLDEGMARVSRNGTLARIARKWFVQELRPEEIQAMRREAEEAARFAYAPYSGFPVGAAVLTASGKTFTGCNVENALLGYTLSALKVALSKAVSSGEYHFRAVMNVFPGDRLGPPAADERQILHEFGADTLVVLEKGPGAYETLMARELLPYPFQGTLGSD